LDLNAERGGLPQPVGGPNVRPFVDVDGDGVCDIFTYGFTPGPPGASVLVASIRPFTLDVRVLSGKDGKVLWKTTFAGRRVTESDPFLSTHQVARIEGFPTGFLPIQTPSGPRIVVKTTDLSYAHAQDPIGLSRGINPLGLFRVPLF